MLAHLIYTRLFRFFFLHAQSSAPARVQRIGESFICLAEAIISRRIHQALAVRILLLRKGLCVLEAFKW